MTHPFELHDLLARVAEMHGLTIADVRNPARLPAFVRARQEFYFLALLLTTRSTERIGAFLYTDRQLVLYGAARYARRHAKPMPRGLQYATTSYRWKHWSTWRSPPRRRRVA